ncbi:DUF4835 family protein [Balneola sp. MJW-20]|uniref:type IX secretion system protein PorD n=1 Tax=Gracilimonas aurantiaca TaxID=3234185 RepID=UPI003465292B
MRPIPYITFCILFFLTAFSTARAQEFNCSVTLNTEQIQDASFTYISELKPVMERYINEYQWTELEVQEHERIDCQVQIIFNSADNDFNFSAQAVFSTRRPIYNTTTQTTTIRISDNTWLFNYPQGKQLIHDELQFDALASFFDFYCYLLLGYDFDSYADQGGEEYYVLAQNVLNLAQTTSAVGWNAQSNNRRNKFTLITDMLTDNYDPLRTAIYKYHRLGLDQFITNEDAARTEILDALKLIRNAKRRTTSTYPFDLFFDAKSREITSVFTEAEVQMRLEAYNVLQETDQGHLSDYDELQN